MKPLESMLERTTPRAGVLRRVKTATAATAGALLLLAPRAALAAEGGSSDPWMDFLWKVVNFTVLMALLVFFARKPLARLFREAAQRTLEAMQQGRSDARDAEQQLAEQQRKIENLQAELVRLREEALNEAREESERVLAEARATAERIKEQMRFQVEQEFKKASSDLKRQLADEAVRLAGEQISKQLDDKARQKLAANAIDQLGDRS